MARVVKEWKKRASFEDIGHMYFRLKLEWAGHLARMREYRPGSWTVKVLQWRNRKHLETIMLNNQGSQMHGRKIRVWRWEHYMAANMGADWMDLAVDKEAWRKLTIRHARYQAGRV
jgi:hypothetical protein